jgi:hypothetical protein
MPVAFVQEIMTVDDDRSTTNYDSIAQRLNVDSDTPAGLIVHTAGVDEAAGVFRILDVWETREHAERFLNDRLMPIVQEMLASTPDARPPDRQTFYDLHDVIRG